MLARIIENYAQVVEETTRIPGVKVQANIPTLPPAFRWLEACWLTCGKGVGQKYLIQHSAGSGSQTLSHGLPISLSALKKRWQTNHRFCCCGYRPCYPYKQIKDTIKQFMGL